ncbi:hypothetical protein GYMLUDRAFT_623233 [Collybiopsis luxurians FD-317 M1]|nr:hypothetical protein GYMLUDRAFT_623233 [Collybiopsis luxurians FD-317 M1]
MIIVILACLVHVVNATPLVPRRITTQTTCFDENNHSIPCQNHSSKTKAIIIVVLFSVAVFSMFACYCFKTSKYPSTRRMRPLHVRVNPIPSPPGFTPEDSQLTKDKTLRAYELTNSDSTLVPPPPAYTPAFKVDHTV